jgi:hypothetical protein
MEIEKLVELFKRQLPNSSTSEEKLRKHIAFLLEYGLTEEQIFFSINYGSKYYHSETSANLAELVLQRHGEIMKYFHIAKAKKDRKALKESEEQYDQKNYNKGANTPSWFRKSFDKHLFE